MASPELEPEAGPTWAERAALPGLAAVLDPSDAAGRKNELIDRTHKQALLRALGSVEGSRILDFGCGNGRLSTWLAERGAVVHGVDSSPAMLARARERAPNLTFSLIDGFSIPAAQATYDVVLCVGVLLYHVASEPRIAQILREFDRVLVADGKVVAIEQIHEGELGRGAALERYLQSFSKASFSRVTTEAVRLGHSRLLAAGSRFSLLARLPLLPAMIRWEARLRTRRPLTGTRYAERLFVVRR